MKLQKEKCSFDKKYICPFKISKYTEAILRTYYGILQSNVSVTICGQRLKAVLKRIEIYIKSFEKILEDIVS